MLLSSQHPPHLYLDFDGTISTVDIGYDLFARRGEIDSWLSGLMSGVIGIRDYWRGVVASFDPPNPVELDEYLLSIPPDPGADRLVAFARANGLPILVVSDGLDYYVDRYLALHGLDVERRCNLLIEWGEASDVLRSSVVGSNMFFSGGSDHVDAAARPRLDVIFPDAAEGCTCLTAACKRNIVLTATPQESRIIYVGDGISDYCPAEHADVIFAKDRLAAYCNAHRLPHYTFRTLDDVTRQLGKILSRKRLRERHQAAMKRKRTWEAEG